MKGIHDVELLAIERTLDEGCTFGRGLQALRVLGEE